MNKKKAFDKWYDDYFMCQQGEDSVYSFDDVKAAFNAGWQETKHFKE